MSISTTVTWNITDTQRDNSDGFVTEIKYSIIGIATETVGSGSTTYRHIVRGGYQVPDHTRIGNETSFNSLNEDTIVGWVKNGIGSTDVAHWEKVIPLHLGNMINESITGSSKGQPNSSRGLPWEIDK
mgnify:CR=1 FL=1